jgi:hypothetical protein
VCDHCGKPFRGEVYGGYPRLPDRWSTYCSPDCRDKARQRVWEEALSEEPPA